eukprot:4403763-Pyramimonas_sp.AAC.1
MFAGALLASICPLLAAPAPVGFFERAAVLEGFPGASWQTAAPPDSVGAAEAREGQRRVISWQTTNGAHTSSSELDEDCIGAAFHRQ